MLYVGITEDHKESATMFGNMVGAQVISQLMASSSSIEGAANNLSGQSCKTFSVVNLVLSIKHKHIQMEACNLFNVMEVKRLSPASSQVGQYQIKEN